MKWLLVGVLAAGALAQSLMEVDLGGWDFKQAGPTVTLTGKVKNDGHYTAQKVTLEFVGVVGEGKDATEAVTREFEVFNVSNQSSKNFSFKFPCNAQLSTGKMRVKTVK